MRILEFDVIKQRLRKNRDCDFSGLVAGSVGYLKAKFNFSPEWDGCKKAASFKLKDPNRVFELGELIGEDNTCNIPSDILLSREFYVSVKGVNDDGTYKIESSEIRIKQEVNS